jgi:hypothetical protein
MFILAGVGHADEEPFTRAAMGRLPSLELQPTGPRHMYSVDVIDGSSTRKIRAKVNKVTAGCGYGFDVVMSPVQGQHSHQTTIETLSKSQVPALLWAIDHENLILLRSLLEASMSSMSCESRL